MVDPLAGLRRNLQHTFTAGSPVIPEWELKLADGDDGGYFAPDSAVWAVHGGMTPIVAGVRALLMQAIHPGALAGVHDHSRFRDDPLGRLAGTIRWIFTVTYGSTQAADDASAWVLRLHEKVVGTYPGPSGRPVPYTANDPELLSWVHLAFTDSFLAAHKVWGGPIPGGADAYVREWARAGELMNVPRPPRTEQELREQINSYYDAGVLTRSPYLAEVISFIRRPPLSRSLLPGYRLLFNGALTTIEPQFRRILGVEPARLGPVPLPSRLGTGVTLRVAGAALGKRGPSELAARSRLHRLGL